MMRTVAELIFLLFVTGIPLWGAIKRVPIYPTFIDGAKEGLNTVMRVFPYLLAMLVAIGMFRASGAIDLLANFLAPALEKIGMPSDVLPLALLRPFSGSASNGLVAEIAQHHGGNSYTAYLAATMMASTETTFYVVAVYFGAVSVQRTRHAIPAGLFADAVGVFASLWVCQWFFMHYMR